MPASTPIKIASHDPPRILRVLGIDMGVATGISSATWDTNFSQPQYEFLLLAPTERGPAMWDIYERWIVQELKYGGQVDNQPYDLIVMEGLAFQGSNVADQARLATLVELAAFRAGVPVLLIASSQHKKWAYGSTKDPHSDAKQEVRSRAERYWGVEIITNDHLADAAFLAEIGCCYLAEEWVEPAYRRDVLHALWKKRDEAVALVAERDRLVREKAEREQARQTRRLERQQQAAATALRVADRKKAAQDKKDEKAIKRIGRAARALVKEANREGTDPRDKADKMQALDL